jgi:coenzyme F420-0:L-glutamate ligase/coenzyme F420-1:gamma-L-glutamate ligase
MQKLSGKKIAVIVGDSCCVMTRRGVTAFALTCAGIDPLKSEVGSKDLFGKKLNITHEAIADQLATAANAVMGNAAQSTPAAVIRNHGMELTEFCGWVPGIPPEEDLYRDLLKE